MRTLYLSDLDGTLIRSNEMISEYTANTVNRLVQAGVCFSYATARSIVTASKVTKGINLEIPVICYNGAFIIANISKKILQANYFTVQETEYIREILTEHNIYPIVYAYIEGREQFSFMEHNLSYGTRFFLKSRIDDVRRRQVQTQSELFIGDMFYFSLISNEVELEPIRDIFIKDRRIHCIYQKDFYSGAQWCELLPAKATKANAALLLKEMLGCDRLVVFGDGKNDLSLFKIADECYAMSNAVAELKEIATAIISSNDEDGVAKWLDENLL